jgi:hypothetical protein
MQQTTAVVLRPREYVLFARVRVGKYRCLLVFGMFETEQMANEWDIGFRRAAETQHISVRNTRLKSVWPGSKQPLDYDCQTEDGLPWEVAADLHLLIPYRHRARRLKALQRRIAKIA